ncbi:hypothetical protein K491DRAFT_637816 [Lophiostoma macrostomum CBS 122681]|uniref:ABM domain-containing protein n=1 Tax=Lophiostoma macrostomum CBS 122681 TaxID=1314788 RepID=A0A6A6SU67_9PLEO|nr:hypothetical protein K491DRAFT_637816 [Lophiostoma macrostomum CBS 122681]
MPSLVVLARLVFADGAARQTAIDKLADIAQNVIDTEPDTFRYAGCIPRDSSDEKSLYVIEEYKSKAAFDSHMATQPVKAIQAYFAANPDLLGGEPTLSLADTSSAFVRPEVAQAKDPFITYASIDYKEGKREEALEGWKTVTTETHNNEPETLAYAILKEQANANNIRTIEVYASEKYFKEVHVPSKQVTENKAKYGDEVRVSIKHVFLKLEAGFLYK